MSCRPAMLRGGKAGLVIHPVLLSLHFCSSTADYKREKEYRYTTMQVGTKGGMETRETSAAHGRVFPEASQLYLDLRGAVQKSSSLDLTQHSHT